MSKAEQEIKKFLEKYRQTERPLLLGVSGGSDSLTLLLAMKDLPIHVAHIDHGWRKTSQEEADELEALVKTLNLPFHRTKGKSQTEADAREERLAFFQKLNCEYHFEAVVLAHHADDLAETVFKRIVEGASLTKLSGLRPIHQLNDVTIWRPFLNLRKSEMTSPSLVIDPTNTDPRFHRGLLRSKLFPYLEGELGRPITHQLAKLGRSIHSLEHYLDQQCRAYPIQNHPFGLFVDLRDAHSMERLHLIGKLTDLPRDKRELACDFLENRSANRYLKKNILVDRGYLFLIEDESVEWHLEQGSTAYSDWKDQLTTYAPLGDLRIAPANACYPGNRPISRWWTAHKVPAFLRSRIPVIWQGDRIIGEFLTGKSNPYSEEGQWLALQFVKKV